MLTLPKSGTSEPAVEASAPLLFDALGGEPTLDQLLVGVWEGLAAHRDVRCLACGGEMTPEYGVHARPIGGRCGSCATTLRC